MKIRGIYILDAPWFFKGVFKIVSMLMPAKIRARVYFLKDISEFYDIVDQNSLLEEYGGTQNHDQV